MKIIGRHYASFRDVRQSEIDIADVSFRQFRIDSFFLGENNFKTLQTFYIHKQRYITPCIKMYYLKALSVYISIYYFHHYINDKSNKIHSKS